MHVLEPKELASRKKHKIKARKNRSRVLLFLIVLLLAGAGGASWYVLKTVQSTSNTATPATTTPPVTQQPTATKPKTKLKTFSGVQFRDLYRATSYPNTEPFTAPPEITGNVTADARIRTLAEKRGFALTSIPVAPIEKSGEQLAGGYQDDLLQPLAAKSWQQLKAAAKAERVSISLISGYRSPKSQRDLFTERLYSTGIKASQIAAGTGDNAVNATLSMTAVPGYSRHHTGYTIDLQCDDGQEFGASICGRWISKDNYTNAKKFGWIPSYPPDGGEQGPEPEAWEYVWVGTEALYE